MQLAELKQSFQRKNANQLFSIPVTRFYVCPTVLHSIHKWSALEEVAALS